MQRNKTVNTDRDVYRATQNQNLNKAKPVELLSRDVLNYALLRQVDPAGILALNATSRFFHTKMSPDIKKMACLMLQDDLSHKMKEYNSQNLTEYLGVMKCVFLGGVNTYKSKIIEQYMQNPFSDTPASTIGVELRVKELREKDFYINLQLWDSAGQERNTVISTAYTKNSDIIVCNANSTDANVEATLSKWLNMIPADHTNKCLLALINTADSVDAFDTKLLEEITNNLKNKFGKNIICATINSTTGAGVEQILNVAAARVLHKWILEKKKLAVLDVELNTSSKCCIM
jgi:small GTP-binding protein